MCGISGILNLTEAQPISEEYLYRMNAILSHRGPDEAGLYMDDWIGLTHRRLNIIDLTKGTQPIHNEDLSLWIIYNGETFNYPELREELLQEGHKFYTHSDTEVIIHLYEEYGPDCLNRLNGQFAMAIWDSSKKELFLARDRMGIRPLFYTIENNRLYFASEIKALLTIPEIRRRIDKETLDQIFTFWMPLPGKTIFENIQELLPGHYLTTSKGKISIQPYWQLSFSSKEDYYNSEQDSFIEQVRETFIDAVRIRLRADVKVGSYLSGGLDSSGVTATIKNQFNNQLESFGMRFSEPDFDEGNFQNQLVNHLSIKHHDIFIKNKDIANAFTNVIWHCEQPILRTAPVPLYLLSNLVKENGYKVVLTGEGGDEIFAGYNIFKEAKIRNFWARYPDSKLRPLLLRRLYPYILNDSRLQSTLKSFFGKGIDLPEDPFFSHGIRWENTSRLKKFFSDETNIQLGGYNGLDEIKPLHNDFDKWDYLAKAQYLEIALFLSNYLLSCQGDRVAMAHSVEIRLPYLDHRLVTLMAQAPPHWKISGLNEKCILKKIFRDMLPKEIVNRPKHPYRAPIKQSIWDSRSEYINEALSKNALEEAGFFNSKKVLLLLNKIDRKESVSEVDNMALCGILSTQIIYERFIKNFPKNKYHKIKYDIFVDKRKK